MLLSTCKGEKHHTSDQRQEYTPLRPTVSDTSQHLGLWFFSGNLILGDIFRNFPEISENILWQAFIQAWCVSAYLINWWIIMLCNTCNTVSQILKPTNSSQLNQNQLVICFLVEHIDHFKVFFASNGHVYASTLINTGNFQKFIIKFMVNFCRKCPNWQPYNH